MPYLLNAPLLNQTQNTPTKHRTIRGLYSAATMVMLALAGCGGGDSYEPQPVAKASANPNVNPVIQNSESLATMRPGDTWMYQWTQTTSKPDPTLVPKPDLTLYPLTTGFYSTHYLDKVDANNKNYVHQVTYSDSARMARTESYSANNQALGSLSDGEQCTNKGLSRSLHPRRTEYAAGTTWSLGWNEDCLKGTTPKAWTHSYTAKTLGLESLSLGLSGQTKNSQGNIQQVTFSTIKYEFTDTYSATGGNGEWVKTGSCWHDMGQDRTVKCDINVTFTPKNTQTPTQAYNLKQDLAFLREVRTADDPTLAVGVSTISQFAGRWKLIGAGNTGCSTMDIDFQGGITAQCSKTELISVTNGTTTTPQERKTPFAATGQLIMTDVTEQVPYQAAVTRTIHQLILSSDNTSPVAFRLQGEMTSPYTAKGELSSGGTAPTTATQSVQWTAIHL